MSGVARYNLCIPQGSTFSNVFVLRHKIVLTADASSEETSLTVSPIPHDISSGSTLTFESVTVTLSADATAGDRTLSVNATSSALTRGTTAKGNLVDLTGKSARAQIRVNFSDTSATASFMCTIGTPATSGEVTITLPSTTTAAIAANMTPDKADDIADLQAATFPTSTEAKLFLPGASAYRWDLELYDTSDPPVVTRYINGLVIVTAEATK